METFRFAGYRVIEFPQTTRTALKQIGERLSPYHDEIVRRWVDRQFGTWQPPGLDRESTGRLFGGLLDSIFRCLLSKAPEECITSLEQTGADLARGSFPFEALILSLHFLEESYMPFLLDPPSEHTQEWLISMDEFLHVAIGALATSYFRVHRDSLLAEAEVGRIVQEGLFPHIPERISDLEVGYIYESATEQARLGGDFLDVFALDDGSTVFFIGDISGHGLEAVSDSVKIRSLFRGFMKERPDPAEVMARLNNVLVRELQGNQFATAMAGVYGVDGCLRLVNAGNPPPFPADCREQLVEKSGLPLAILAGGVYHVVETALRPGGLLVFYTDGLIEARQGADLLGEERVYQLIEEMSDASPRDIADHLLDAALRHAGGKLADDVTILVMRRCQIC